MAKKEEAPGLRLQEKIGLVMKDFSYVQKDAKVMNYKAVTHDQVIARLRPHLIKHGLGLRPSVVMRDTREVDGLRRDNKKVFRTDVTVELTVFHTANAFDWSEEITFLCTGGGVDGEDKDIGKAVSIAIKYGILKLFCVETGENDESRYLSEEEPEEPEAKPKSKAKAKKVVKVSKQKKSLPPKTEEKADPRLDELADVRLSQGPLEGRPAVNGRIPSLKKYLIDHPDISEYEAQAIEAIIGIKQVILQEQQQQMERANA